MLRNLTVSNYISEDCIAVPQQNKILLSALAMNKNVFFKKL
jgi:hypothetical protein